MIGLNEIIVVCRRQPAAEWRPSMTQYEEYEGLQKQIQSLDMGGRYQELMAVTERFVQLAGQLYGFGDAQYASALNEYAGAHRNLGRYEKAETLYKDALHVMAGALGEQSYEYATILNNMAGMYRLQGCYERSEKAFLKVRNIYANALGKTHFLYISSLNNLGLLYQDMKRYEEAIRLHRESLSILSGMEHQNKVTVATTLINLASAMMGAGDTGKVYAILSQALQLYRETVGEGHPLYGYGLNALATYHTKLGDYTPAYTALEQALTLIEAAYGQDSERYAQAKRNLEAVREKRDQNDEGT